MQEGTAPPPMNPIVNQTQVQQPVQVQQTQQPVQVQQLQGVTSDQMELQMAKMQMEQMKNQQQMHFQQQQQQNHMQTQLQMANAPAAAAPVIVNTNVNQSVTVGHKKVNHCCWGCISFWTVGACIPCWIGACFGCCPTCY